MTTLDRRSLLGAGLAATCALPFVSWRSGHAYQEVDVADPGTLNGKIRFAGTVPAAEEILISKDNHICGQGTVVSEPVRIDASGGLADSVVLVNGIAAGKPWPAHALAPEIVQEGCRFHPYVQAAPKGVDLTILNKDPLLHNIHAYELIGRARRTMFNIAQPMADQVDAHPLKLRRGDVVEVDCDAHNWMSAWIYTLDHPYFSISGKDGGFSIDGLPPGSHEATVWHPTLGAMTASVEVAPGATTTLDLILEPSEA